MAEWSSTGHLEPSVRVMAGAFWRPTPPTIIYDSSIPLAFSLPWRHGHDMPSKTSSNSHRARRSVPRETEAKSLKNLDMLKPTLPLSTAETLSPITPPDYSPSANVDVVNNTYNILDNAFINEAETKGKRVPRYANRIYPIDTTAFPRALDRFSRLFM